MLQKLSKMSHVCLFLETEPVALERTAARLKKHLEEELLSDD